jgi:DNA-binding SARP family transcriptional activator/tetratricopeptide (TPR) repeat protein
MRWEQVGGAVGEELSSAGLARLVRDGRQAAGLTQLELAAEAGVSVGVIRDLEQGRTERPRRRSVARIAVALGFAPERGEPMRGGQHDDQHDVPQNEPHGGSNGELHGGLRGRPHGGPIPGGTDSQPDHGAAATGPYAGVSAGKGAVADAGPRAGRIRLQVLGSLAVWRDGMAVDLGPARQRAVLGLLAVQPNTVVRREAICEALWPGDPPATAVSMIQSYVGKLRRVLDPAHVSGGSSGGGGGRLLAAAGSGYRLQVTGAELDLIAFGQLCGQARAAERTGQPAEACDVYEQALELWRGEPLADVDALRGHPAVDGLARQWAEAVERYAGVASGQGWHGRVLGPLRSLTAREPLNERAHARLMIALAGSGQQATALDVFDAIRRRLDGQLGIRPGAELAAAQARVLRQHIPAAVAETAQPGTAQPGTAHHDTTAYPGARPQPGAATHQGAAHRNGTAGPAPDGPAAARPGDRPATRPGDRPADRPRDRPADRSEGRRHRDANERPAGSVVPRQLPAAASHFVGRADEMKALSSLLDQARDGTGAVAISVLGGSAGVGKTTLAVQWAHQVADQFPDGQLYVNLRGFGPAASPVSPIEALRGFLDAFAVPTAQLPAGQEALAGLYRSLTSGRRVLVVLDNAKDTAQVRPLLPGGPGCVVVVTSRSHLTGLVASDGAQPLTLDVLSDVDARELLARRMGATRLDGEPDAVDDLAGLCARLPLALAITAARAAAHPGVRLRMLASELDDELARLDALETGEATTSIRGVFSWSYTNLSPEAARMFRLLALHPGPDIAVPAAASLAGTGAQQAIRLLRALTSAGLLTEPVPGRFAFHDLLRAYAAELVRATENDDERRAAVHRVLDHYLHTARTAATLSQLNRETIALNPPRPGSAPQELADESAALAWFRSERQNLRAAIAQAVADGFDAHAWQLTCILAPFAQRSGHWHQHEWSTVLTTALTAAQRQGHLSGQARVHWELGLICIRLRRYDDALSHLSRALDMYRRLGNRAGQAYCHLGLALMFDQQDHDEQEAIQHAELALELYRTSADRAGQARALNAAGWYSTKSGDPQRALAYCLEALDIHRVVGSRRGEAATLDSIGYAHHQLGHYPQAIASYQSALVMLKRLADSDAEALVLTHLGDSHRAAGDLQAARSAWQKAMAILDDGRDPSASEVRAKLLSLAVVEA